MGVYFFACAAGYVKVGHHRVTAARPNVYYRVARRGFQSCVHPVQRAFVAPAQRREPRQ